MIFLGEPILGAGSAQADRRSRTSCFSKDATFVYNSKLVHYFFGIRG